MGIAKKTDGRYVVGVGVDNANDYKGSAAYRDIYIQLTSSGATAKSEEYLTFLKDYAVNANALGEPIMPPSVNVWISNNGVTTAVEADDVSIDGNNYTICGIKWNGSTWDYSGAGQGKSGGGLPPYTSADKGKFLGLGEADPVETAIVSEQTGEFIADFGIGKGFTVSNPNLAFFQSAELGDTCEAIVGGSSYTLTYADYNGTLAFLDGSMLYALVPIYVDTEVEEVEFVSTTAALHDTATISATASVPSVEPKWAGILYQFEVGKTTPQDIINATKEGKLVVMGTQAEAYGWNQGLSILMAQFEYSTDTYGVRFIGINSGGNGVSVKGDNLEAYGLNSAYVAGST